MTGIPAQYERVEVASERALWDWLAANHAQEKGVILVTWKAATRDKYVGREAVLDALVAHGWIDGRRYKLDEARTAQLITPRQTQSWAASYKARAARLEAEGRMHKAGRARIRAAKASGSWTDMADVDALRAPDDLVQALGAACQVWEGLAPSYRRNVLRWIKSARTAPTRDKRIAAAAKATKSGEKLAQM
ncbi:MAG: YdeI/OmpD-associated family protein [Pseudomonadota bacterium]